MAQFPIKNTLFQGTLDGTPSGGTVDFSNLVFSGVIPADRVTASYSNSGLGTAFTLGDSSGLYWNAVSGDVGFVDSGGYEIWSTSSQLLTFHVLGVFNDGISSDSIKAKGTSSGFLIKNNAGTTVASFGVGGSSSTNISLSGNVALGSNNLTMTGSIAATGSRVAKVWATDIESTNVPTANGVNLVTVSSSDTLTNKTLTAPRFADLGFIADANGNELIILDTVASAVNEITFANAATGNPPTFSATGGDTNIGIRLTPKGTGAVQIQDGLVGTPSLAFANDLDTGIFRESANELRIGAGGLSVAVFSNNGTTTFFGPASSPIARVTATGETYFSMQAFSGALWGVRLGDPAAKAYIRAAASQTANILELQNSSGTALASFDSGGNPSFPKTITAGGTTGAQTINRAGGSVNFAAAATSLVVTNSLVTANSVIIATVATNDTTMKSVAAVAASGSFTLHANAAATAETRVNFLVIN